MHMPMCLFDDLGCWLKFDVMILILLSKTSFYYLFGKDLNHFWATYWVDFVEDCATDVYLRRSFM